MDTSFVLDNLKRAIEQLLGRASGPMHFRLLMQPVMASILAIRAGIRDARDGSPVFLWGFLTNRAERGKLAKSAWKDIGKIFCLAIILDAVYQGIQLHAFFPLQTLLVAIGVAVVPYVVLRGPVTRLIRMFRTAPPAAASEAKP